MTTRNEEIWQPIILNPQIAAETAKLRELIAGGKVARTFDRIHDQLRDLVQLRNPQGRLSPEEASRKVRDHLGQTLASNYGRWVFYPWSGYLVHLLPPAEFREVRFNRNQNKITAEEQAWLARKTVGVVGLSVGNAVARTLALEGACGCLKLADFDTLDLSNLNRIQAGVADLGLNKVVLAARQIAELDPYLPVLAFTEGLNEGNLDDFLQGEPRLDILVDECDGLDMKIRMRERAREFRLPVLMETSDRDMLDVERFDLEPERPFFHGLVPNLNVERLRSLPPSERVACVLQIIGADTISARLAASLQEVGRSIQTWPQLGSDVALGGGVVTAAVRALALGQPLNSGRIYVDLEQALRSSRPS